MVSILARKKALLTQFVLKIENIYILLRMSAVNEAHISSHIYITSTTFKQVQKPLKISEKI